MNGTARVAPPLPVKLCEVIFFGGEIRYVRKCRSLSRVRDGLIAVSHRRPLLKPDPIQGAKVSICVGLRAPADVVLPCTPDRQSPCLQFRNALEVRQSALPIFRTLWDRGLCRLGLLTRLLPLDDAHHATMG